MDRACQCVSIASREAVRQLCGISRAAAPVQSALQSGVGSLILLRNLEQHVSEWIAIDWVPA